MTGWAPPVVVVVAVVAWAIAARFVAVSPIMVHAVAVTFWAASLASLAVVTVVSTIMWLRS